MRQKERLVSLYQQMYEHTKAECDRACKLARFGLNRCCDRMYCEMAIQWARERWHIVLEPTGHPTLPLMGADVCTAAPHLRPLCTVHQCCINSVGAKVGDEAWTAEYFRLRDAIERYEDPLEMEEVTLE